MRTTDSKLIIPPGADELVMAGRRRRLAADANLRETAVARLIQEYTARRTALLGTSNEAKLAEYMAIHRGEENAEVRRSGSLAFARGIGIDMIALQRLNSEYADKINAGIERPTGTESPAEGLAPAPSSAVHTSWGSWESGHGISYWECKGKTVSAHSHHSPPASQTGSQMALHASKTTSYGGLSGWWENGFLVEYTPPASGRLLVTAYLTCLVDDHFISTWDEWGWSGFKGRTTEFGIVETYSDWNDWSADDEFFTTFVPGLSSKATDGGPGIVRMHLPGRTRAWAAAGDRHVPAGVPILLYVGTHQKVTAACNDVETFIGVNSAWQLTKITVSTFAG